MSQARDVWKTRAWVLHPEIKSDRSGRDAKPALDEAISLALALPGLNVVGSEIVRLSKPQAGMLFGSGKIAELQSLFYVNEIIYRVYN